MALCWMHAYPHGVRWRVAAIRDNGPAVVWEGVTGDLAVLTASIIAIGEVPAGEWRSGVPYQLRPAVSAAPWDWEQVAEVNEWDSSMLALAQDECERNGWSPKMALPLDLYAEIHAGFVDQINI